MATKIMSVRIFSPYSPTQAPGSLKNPTPKADRKGLGHLDRFLTRMHDSRLQTRHPPLTTTRAGAKARSCLRHYHDLDAKADALTLRHARGQDRHGTEAARS